MAAKGKGKGKCKGKGGAIPECWFVILCGLPGSGKSTFVNGLESKGWIRVSQDELGSQDECRKLIEKSLRHKRSVFLDRCNVHIKERRMWLNITKEFLPLHIQCIFFNTSVEECKTRVQSRKNHPNLQGDGSGEVIDDFARSLEPPATREGFEQVHIVSSSSESTALQRVFASFPISLKGI